MNESINYIDQKELRVLFTSCFLRVDRIIQRVHSLEQFQRIIDRPMLTNGKIVQLVEMRSPASEIEEIIQNKLVPLGFEYQTDLILLEEQLIYGVKYRLTPLLNQAIPGSEAVDWLETIIRMDGNFVWWVEG